MFSAFVGFHNESTPSAALRNSNSDKITTVRPNEGSVMSRFDEIDIPYNDIYTQEYFLYAYSKLTEYRKHFYDSKEGNTYLVQATEERCS